MKRESETAAKRMIAIQPTDSEIRRALIVDRDNGFTLMVVKFQPGIYSGARRLTHRHEDAEEVAQDTFLRAYKALGGYSDERIGDLKLSGWLWTIAINLCRNRAAKSTKTEPIEDATLAAAADIDELDSTAWNQRLDTLSTNQRVAVVLRHVVDLPIADISDIVERPHGTVKADISRGLTQLRDAISREGQS